MLITNDALLKVSATWPEVTINMENLFGHVKYKAALFTWHLGKLGTHKWHGFLLLFNSNLDVARISRRCQTTVLDIIAVVARCYFSHVLETVCEVSVRKEKSDAKLRFLFPQTLVLPTLFICRAWRGPSHVPVPSSRDALFPKTAHALPVPRVRLLRLLPRSRVLWGKSRARSENAHES